MLAYKEGPHVRLVSRHGIDHVHRYPLVMAAVASLPAKTLVVDAELAVFDQQLRSRFDWLRHRQPAEVATPPVLIAFDVLYLKGRDLTKRPLRDRRSRLEDLLLDADLVHRSGGWLRTAWMHGHRCSSTPMRGSWGRTTPV